jgi:hypothetical protein
MGVQSGTADRLIGRIAGRRHGIVARAELLAGGVTRKQIERRLARGTLLGEYPGVYRVGHRAPSSEASYTAAVLAAGAEAGLSGRAAAWLQRLIKGAPPPPEVTSPRQRHIAGLATRCCRSLDQRDLTRCRGIPCTTVPRTLVDLAAVLDEEGLARACHEATVLYRATPGQVEVALRRKPNAKNAATLRRILHGDVHVTLSRLESRFLKLLREAALPLPHTNRPAGGRYVDCRWPGHKLTVELDSYRFHSSRFSWEQDRRREREAYGRGDDHRRYVWGDVFESPDETLAELRTVLCG